MADTQKKPEGVALYARFAFAGAVCCSVTHGAFTPVDVYVTSSFDLRRANFDVGSRPRSSSTPSPITVACSVASARSSRMKVLELS